VPPTSGNIHAHYNDIPATLTDTDDMPNVCPAVKMKHTSTPPIDDNSHNCSIRITITQPRVHKSTDNPTDPPVDYVPNEHNVRAAQNTSNRSVNSDDTTVLIDNCVPNTHPTAKLCKTPRPQSTASVVITQPMILLPRRTITYQIHVLHHISITSLRHWSKAILLITLLTTPRLSLMTTVQIHLLQGKHKIPLCCRPMATLMNTLLTTPMLHPITNPQIQTPQQRLMTYPRQRLMVTITHQMKSRW